MSKSLPTIPEMAELVAQSSDYRVVRRLVPPEEYTQPDNLPKRVALMVDLETTSFDSSTAIIIEVGMVLFEYSPANGKIYRILETYGALNDPGCPIPEEIVNLTGITDEMVRGQSYDIKRIEQMIQQTNIVIAHNARYDRRVAERFFSSLENKPWGCSHSQIPWVKMGMGSTKLEFLLFKMGFFTDGHRAVNDCLATIHLLSWEPEGIPVLGILLETARETTAKIWAVGSPYATKDALKERGYYWSDGGNGRPKAWWKAVPEGERDEELAWLGENIYQGNTESVIIERVDALSRFSVRD